MVELDDTFPPSDVDVGRLARSLSVEARGTMVDRPRSTIEPHVAGAVGAAMDARSRVGAARAAPYSNPDADSVPGFVVRQTLGEGGMGLVRVAEQLSLGRQVAVKTVKRALAGDPRVTTRLLREAWLAGRVEHPNVVPIYDLGLDEAGRPHIAMRLVEGTPWDELLGDPARVSAKHAATDVLEWHLRVLIQVTHAVSRAHAKGIVHRDIKPGNVMIGEFGEVYLLDWGIAVSLVPDPEGRLPLAAEATETAGTPGYMAPEMLGGAESLIDERTDVYLLGATLYEIVTGTPPHRGAAVADIVRSILHSTPTFPPDAPRELAAICRRAMRRLRKDRYPSVHEVRAALTDFLTHRGSSALAEEATARRDELFASLEGPSDSVDRHALYEAFGAARFGYQEALKLWPDNGAAREGLRGICERMIAFELAHGSAEAAQAALAALPSPSPELTARVAAALRARADEKRRLATLERQYDPAVGSRTRLGVGSAACLVGIVGPFVITARPGFAWNFGLKAVTAIACAGLLAWARRPLGETKLNRDMALVVLAGFVVQALLVPAGVLLGLSLAREVSVTMLVWALLHLALAATTEPRLLVTALAFAAAFVVSAAWPALAYVAQSLASVCAVLVVGWAWRAADTLANSRRTVASHPAEAHARERVERSTG